MCHTNILQIAVVVISVFTWILENVDVLKSNKGTRLCDENQSWLNMEWPARVFDLSTIFACTFRTLPVPAFTRQQTFSSTECWQKADLPSSPKDHLNTTAAARQLQSRHWDVRIIYVCLPNQLSNWRCIRYASCLHYIKSELACRFFA